MKTSPSLLAAIFVPLLGGPVAARADSLSTTFGANAIAGGGWTNLFDLTVANPGGIRFTAFTANLAQAGGTLTLNVYVRPVTYVGAETTTAGWMLVSSGTVTPTTNNGPQEFDTTDFILPAGTYGFALVNTNYQVGFNIPAADYSNSALLIDNGAIVSGALSGGIVSSNATWNGTITYDVVPEPSTLALLAGGLSLGLLRSRRGAARE